MVYTGVRRFRTVLGMQVGAWVLVSGRRNSGVGFGVGSLRIPQALHESFALSIPSVVGSIQFSVLRCPLAGG